MKRSFLPSLGLSMVSISTAACATFPGEHQTTSASTNWKCDQVFTGDVSCSIGGEIRTTCYVVITADRGLCGGYNAGVQRAAEGEIKADVRSGKSYAIIPVGRKAESYFRFRGYALGQGFAISQDTDGHAGHMARLMGGSGRLHDGGKAGIGGHRSAPDGRRRFATRGIIAQKKRSGGLTP